MIGIIANKKVQVIILIAALIGVAFYTGVFPTGQFGTGLDLNTDTVSIEGLDEWYGCQEESEFPELIIYPSIDKLVTAWYSDEDSTTDSVALTVQGEISIKHPPWIGWDAEDAWYRVTIADESTDGEFDKIILETGGPNEKTDNDYVSYTGGATGTQELYENKDGEWMTGTFPTGVSKILPAITFTLDGPHTGGLRIEMITVFSRVLWANSEPFVVARDEIYLVSGKGKIELANQDISNYAAGQTIAVKVDTGFSGKAQEGEEPLPWTVNFYGSDGILESSYPVGDNRVGYTVNHVIPADARTGECKVTLWNPLFLQDERVVYTLSEEDLEKVPVLTESNMVFDKSKYMLGDVITLKLTGTPNTIEGNSDVVGFKVWARHGKSGVDYLDGYDGTYVPCNDGFSATMKMTPRIGDVYILVEAIAFDGRDFDASANLPYGLPSNMARKSIYVEDEIPPTDLMMMYIIMVLVIVVLAIVAFILPIGIQYKAIIILLGVVGIIIYLLYELGYLW